MSGVPALWYHPVPRYVPNFFSPFGMKTHSIRPFDEKNLDSPLLEEIPDTPLSLTTFPLVSPDHDFVEDQLEDGKVPRVFPRVNRSAICTRSVIADDSRHPTHHSTAQVGELTEGQGEMKKKKRLAPRHSLLIPVPKKFMAPISGRLLRQPVSEALVMRNVESSGGIPTADPDSFLDINPEAVVQIPSHDIGRDFREVAYCEQNSTQEKRNKRWSSNTKRSQATNSSLGRLFRRERCVQSQQYPLK